MSVGTRPSIVLAGWEMRGAIRNRWAFVVAGLYAVAAAGIALVNLRSMSSLGLRGVGAAIDGLIGLAILVPPLFGILLGAGIISGSREQGMLSLVAAQPIRRSEITWGSAVGAILTVWAGVAIGLSLAAVILAPSATGSDLLGFLIAVVVTLVAGAVGVSLGMLISVYATNRGQAMMTAMAVWFLAALGVDVILASLAPVALGPGVLMAVTMLNPLATVRTLGMLLLDPSSLGPFGSFIEESFGSLGSIALFALVAIAWLVAPLLLAGRKLRLSDI